MKITAQEEYGLRILVRIARSENARGITIPEISQAEGLSDHNVAKLCRILRIAGFIKSSRGKNGGYLLSYPAEEINLGAALDVLGGRLYSPEFCLTHSGNLSVCANAGECNIQSLWQLLQDSLDSLLKNLTLYDLAFATNRLSSLSQNQFATLK
ncbi:MAG TPA: Rrf2 family transcriptional regulator [Caldithrix sp.]|nr:Rrf2 family transcriptional regulator [Caldithrix sp.]